MPFAGYKDWDACIVDQKSKGKTAIAARRICGKLQAEHEKKEKSMSVDVQEPEEVVEEEFATECEFTKRIEEPDHTYVTGPVLIPETVDGQGDIISEEEIKKTAWDFMMSLQKGESEAGFMHKQALDDEDAMFVESYLLPAKRVIKSVPYPRGTWFLAAVVWNEDLRKRIKGGEVRGFSIGGRGKAVEEPDDE